MTTTIDYDIKDVAPYINWLYFYHAWGVAGKPDEAKRSLRQEAEAVSYTHLTLPTKARV